MDTPMPEAVKKLVVANVNEVEKVAADVDFVFSAVDMTKDEIRAIEEAYAKTETPVVSNNSAHRWTKDVPMVVPEINAAHFELINDQKKRLGTTRGFIAVKPNCSIQSYTPCLAAWKEFGPKEVVATTYQAISGAGKISAEKKRRVSRSRFVFSEHMRMDRSHLPSHRRLHASAYVYRFLTDIQQQCLSILRRSLQRNSLSRSL